MIKKLCYHTVATVLKPEDFKRLNLKIEETGLNKAKWLRNLILKELEVQDEQNR